MVSDGFQVSHVQEMVFEQAEALLQVSDEFLVGGTISRHGSNPLLAGIRAIKTEQLG